MDSFQFCLAMGVLRARPRIEKENTRNQQRTTQKAKGIFRRPATTLNRLQSLETSRRAVETSPLHSSIGHGLSIRSGADSRGLGLHRLFDCDSYGSADGFYYAKVVFVERVLTDSVECQHCRHSRGSF
jgi:hypothetical protein